MELNLNLSEVCYIKGVDEEVVVTDTVYDFVCYVYGNDDYSEDMPLTHWLMQQKVHEIAENGAVVMDITGAITEHLNELKALALTEWKEEIISHMVDENNSISDDDWIEVWFEEFETCFLDGYTEYEKRIVAVLEG